MDGTVFACLLFTHGFLWLVNEAAWPPPGTPLPDAGWPLVAAAGFAASAAALWLADRALGRGPKRLVVPAVLLALPPFLLGFGADLYGYLSAGLDPTAHSFAASVYANLFWQGLHAAVVLVMALYLVARTMAGMVDPVRRVTFDNVRLFWLYSAAQGLAGLALTHVVPHALG